MSNASLAEIGGVAAIAYLVVKETFNFLKTRQGGSLEATVSTLMEWRVMQNAAMDSLAKSVDRMGVLLERLLDKQEAAARDRHLLDRVISVVEQRQGQRNEATELG